MKEIIKKIYKRKSCIQNGGKKTTERERGKNENTRRKRAKKIGNEEDWETIQEQEFNSDLLTKYCVRKEEENIKKEETVKMQRKRGKGN